MLFAHIHVFLEHFRTFLSVVAGKNVSAIIYGEGDDRTFGQICVTNFSNFQRACPIARSVHKVWICPMESRDKPMVDKSTDEQLTCHAKGDVASIWIALRYACANLSRGGSGRWRHKNLFALVLLPEFERGKAEKDITRISEVSDRSGEFD